MANNSPNRQHRNEEPTSKSYMMRTVELSTDTMQRVYHNHYEMVGKSALSIGIITRYVGDESDAEKAEDKIRQMFIILHDKLREEHEQTEVLLADAKISAIASFSHPRKFESQIKAPDQDEFLDLLVLADKILNNVETLWLKRELSSAEKVNFNKKWKKQLNKAATRIRNEAKEIQNKSGNDMAQGNKTEIPPNTEKVKDSDQKKDSQVKKTNEQQPKKDKAPMPEPLAATA